MPRTSRPRPSTAPSGDSVAVRFSAILHAPASARPVAWTFLQLPDAASSRLPSRGQVAVQGTFGSARFSATLEPDGRGGHWLKVPRTLRASAGAAVGELVDVEISPASRVPEPRLPADLRSALANAAPAARHAWTDITPAARRDWIHWIVSPKQRETRAKRIAAACDMLAKGKRRPCCFDRSGKFSKSLECPTAAE